MGEENPMRAMMAVGMLVFGALVLARAPAAQAGDCREWSRLSPDARSAEVGGMITGHMNSNTTKRYTSENRVAIQRCLRGFVAQIVEEIDAACEERPNANAEFVDDIFDRYLLSCI
jgi:hypothetical protein